MERENQNDSFDLNKYGGFIYKSRGIKFLDL